MANPEQVEELESLEAIYEGSEEVSIKRQSTHADAYDMDGAPNLIVYVRHETKKKVQLTFRIWLPADYLVECEVTSVTPIFELESSFFSKAQLSVFCAGLDQLFEDQSPCPILFSWIEWLRTEAPEMNLLNRIGFVDNRAVWVQEPEEEEQYEEYQEHHAQTCCNCAKNTQCQVLHSCKHVFCSDCMAACIQVESANSDVHCCPLPSCRTPLSKEDLICGEKPPEAWMHIVRQIQDTSFQDAIVFCPRCEDRGMDIPILMGHGRKSKPLQSESDTANVNCRCFSCDTDFCGICRSLCHPGSTCFAEKSRILGLAKRRPPLASDLQDKASHVAQEIKKKEADKAKDAGEAMKGQTFDSLQNMFLGWHEASILEAVHSIFGADVSLYKAPVSKKVKDRFMATYVQYPGIELRPAFHGSKATNYVSIFDNGLLIPGDGNCIPMAHGAAHGRGVYTANLNAAWLSRGFCSDPIMLVCGVLQTSMIKHVFDAMVVTESSHVVPLLVCEGSRCAGQLLPLPPPRTKPTSASVTTQKDKVDVGESAEKKAKSKFKARLAKMSNRH